MGSHRSAEIESIKRDILREAGGDMDAMDAAMLELVESGCRSKAEAEQLMREHTAWLMGAISGERADRYWQKREEIERLAKQLCDIADVGSNDGALSNIELLTCRLPLDEQSRVLARARTMFADKVSDKLNKIPW